MTPRLQRLRVLAAGIFSLILAVGVARFAYTPLLPVMRRQAGLGVAAAGGLATVNYAGYLCGALISSLIKDIVVKDRLYRLGMVLAVITTAMMALSTSPWVWGLSRFLAGLASSAGMLLGTALVLNWLVRHGHRPELGVHFSGLGLGIAVAAGLSAVLGPLLDWRGLWWAYAGLGCLLLWPALAWLPAADPSVLTRAGQPMPDRPPGRAFLTLLMGAYFCAGVGYVVSATFIVAIIDAMPALAGRGMVVFLAIGLASAPSCIGWDRVARQIGETRALVAAALIQIVGILLPVYPGGFVAAMLGAILFGGSFVGIVSLVLTMAGRYYPTRPAKMMGRLTVAYGVAQILAPAVTGAMAVRLGGYESGLYLAAASMMVAVVLLGCLVRLEAKPGAAFPADAGR